MPPTAVDQLGISRSSQSREALQASMSRPVTAAASATDGFRATLSAARSAFPGLDGKEPEDVVRRAAEELVARALVQPFLAMMHDDALKSGLFGNTPGEKTFRPLLDAEFSKRTVSGMKNDLVEALVHRLLKRGGSSINAARIGTEMSGSKVDLHG